MDEWLGLGSLAIAALVALFSLSRKPPFVPASRLFEAQSTITTLTDALRVARQEITDLQAENRILERSRAQWQRWYETLKEEGHT